MVRTPISIHVINTRVLIKHTFDNSSGNQLDLYLGRHDRKVGKMCHS